MSHVGEETRWRMGVAAVASMAVATGATNAAIARRLGITKPTLGRHRPPCLHPAFRVGDAAGALARRRQWLGSVRFGDVSLFIGLGLLATFVLEALNVYVWENWSYLPDMPTIFGIGVLSILQWNLLPLLTLWLARRHLGWTPSRGSRS